MPSPFFLLNLRFLLRFTPCELLPSPDGPSAGKINTILRPSNRFRQVCNVMSSTDLSGPFALDAVDFRSHSTQPPPLNFLITVKRMDYRVKSDVTLWAL
jgi:hypothetical protein